MSINRAEFTIAIKTEADLSGANANLAILQGQREALIQMGKATDDVDAKINALQSTIRQANIEGIGKNAEKASEGFKILGRGAHDAHAAIRAIGEAVPGLEMVSRFLFTGITAAIGGVALAFSFLKDKLDEFGHALEALDTGPGARGEWADKIKDNARDAAVETARFNERLREAKSAQETLAASTDNLIAAQHAAAGAAREEADAQKALQLARLELAEKLGQVTPEQAVKIRLEIDDEAFKQELAAKIAEIQAELTARLKELKANEDQEPTLWGARTGASAASAAATNARDKNAGKLSQEKANLAAEQQALESAQKAYDEANKWYRLDNIFTGETKTLADQIQQKQALITSLQAAIKQQEAKQTPLESAAAVAKDQADNANANYETAAKTSSDIAETIKKLQSDLAAANAKNAALLTIHNQTTSVTAISQGGPEAQADWQSQGAYSRESGPQAAIDANQAVTDARVILAHIRGQRPQDVSPEDTAQLHQLHLRIIGFLENNVSPEVISQRGQLSDLDRRLSGLESQFRNNRSSR